MPYYIRALYLLMEEPYKDQRIIKFKGSAFAILIPCINYDHLFIFKYDGGCLEGRTEFRWKSDCARVI